MLFLYHSLSHLFFFFHSKSSRYHYMQLLFPFIYSRLNPFKCSFHTNFETDTFFSPLSSLSIKQSGWNLKFTRTHKVSPQTNKPQKLSFPFMFQLFVCFPLQYGNINIYSPGDQAQLLDTPLIYPSMPFILIISDMILIISILLSIGFLLLL